MKGCNKNESVSNESESIKLRSLVFLYLKNNFLIAQ